MEDSSIPLLPDVPENEAWQEMPNSTKNIILEGLGAPTIGGVEDVVSVVIPGAHHLSHLVKKITIVFVRKTGSQRNKIKQMQK